MKDKTFKKALTIILIVGLLITVAHIIYAAYAYNNSSIIHFVSKEWW